MRINTQEFIYVKRIQNSNFFVVKIYHNITNPENEEKSRTTGFFTWTSFCTTVFSRLLLFFSILHALVGTLLFFPLSFFNFSWQISFYFFLSSQKHFMSLSSTATSCINFSTSTSGPAAATTSGSDSGLGSDFDSVLGSGSGSDFDSVLT